MASDFADDIHAHETWQPRPLQPSILAEWTGGVLPAGFRFGPSARVETRRGPRATGLVVTLLGLEPEPRYLVELASGERVETRQWILQEAD